MGEPDRTGRFEVADRIFSDAINLPEAQRTAFVREKSGSDSGLCDSVLRLLANFERLGSFLESPAVSVPAESVPEFRTGEVLCNRFKIAERIGCGGMGEVFRAEDLALGDMVALKTIRPGWRGDPGMLSRFREEIRLARRISHPNVCKIFDLFTHDSAERSQPFFTMEYLNGDTLSDRLRSGPLLQGEALALAEQIALGLDAAHAAGVVHRDLKPANILLVHGTQGVRAVITDFGLARTFAAEEGHGGLTHAGQILGSPDYMAPEQFEGREITSAADIFAFGLIVFEMLCGRRPYPSDSLFQAAVRRLTENPAPIRQFAPEIPASRERAISKCLARNPAERYPSAGAFIKDLSPDGAMWRLADSAPSRRSILLAGSVAAPVAAIFGFYRYLKWKPGMPDVPLVMLNSLTHASGDSVEADAVELILKKDLAQSAHIRVLTMEEVSATWRRISNVPAVSQPPAAFDPRLAREIALRKGAQIAVFGNLGRVAERRVLLLQIELLGGTPEEARKTWTNQFAAARPSDLASVGRDAGGWIRRTIGESAGDIETRNRLPEDLTTPYWAALEEFVRANEAWRAGKSDAAVLHLKAALRVDPGFALAAARMADILLSSGQVDEAYQYWDKAAKMLGDRNLTDRESLRIRGQFALDIGQDAEAEQVFSRYALEFPSDALPLFYKASAQERLGRKEAAEQSFTEAIQRDGAYSFVMGRAIHHLGQGRLSEAERDWRVGRDGNPHDWTDRIRCGIDFARGDFGGIRRSLMHLKSAGSPAFQSKAFALEACFEAEQGNWSQAEHAIEEGLAFDRKTAQPSAAEQEKLYLQAQILLARGRFSDAVRTCSACLRTSPGLIVRMQIGCVLAQAASLREAAKCLPAALPAWPIYSVAARRLEGEIAFARRQFGPALSLFRLAVQPASLRVWPSFLVRGALAAGDEHTAYEALRDLFNAPGLYWLGAEMNEPGFVRKAADLVRSQGQWPDLLKRAGLFSSLAHPPQSQ